jgi:KDO2-lipid IV(A) lauroyltransferase
VASRALRTFQLGSALARAVPGPVADVAARGIGRAAVPMAGGWRGQIERNLRRVHGPAFGGRALRRAVAETIEGYARYWIESFRLPGTSAADLDAGIVVENWDAIELALDKGNGVILALPHLGCWEWAGYWVATVKQKPITVVVETIEPPDLRAWFVDLRESFGMHVVPLGPQAAGDVLAALRANHIVCLLCDRDIGGGGVEVDFFGERTTLPAGPATLGLRTGAPVLPTAAYYGGESGRLGVVRPPLDTARTGRLRDDVARVTQDLAHELEDLIRRAPEQWHLLQPNWPSDRDGQGPAKNPSAPTADPSRGA